MGKLTAAVLAGGMSRRFGKDKTLAVLEGRPLIQWVAEGVKDYADEIMVVSKDPSKYEFLGITQAVDKYEQQCPLVGFLTAFDKAENDAVFMISADTPLFPFSALPEMLEISDKADAVVPVVDGKMYPCAAVYRKSVVDKLTELYNAGEYKLVKAFKHFNVKYPDNDFFDKYCDKNTAFINVNTPEDLLRVERLRGAK